MFVCPRAAHVACLPLTDDRHPRGDPPPPLQKHIPSAAEAVVSLVTTALIKNGPFDEELSPQDQPHKHNAVTGHMFTPLKS